MAASRLGIGVLALQGAVRPHEAMLRSLGVRTRLVSEPADLQGLAGLVLPGGESTTLSAGLKSTGLGHAIREFARSHPVLGTCAGLILMSGDAQDGRVDPLNILGVTVVRNHYGPQAASFVATIQSTDFVGMRGLFIRAPAIRATTSQQVLGTLGGKAVVVQEGPHVGCAFHPELSTDTRIHAHWLRQVC